MEQLRKSIQVLLFLGLVIAFLYIGKPLLFPLALAMVLAMLFRTLCDRLEKRGWPRWLTAIFSVALLLAGMTLVVSLLFWQLQSLAKNPMEIKEQVMTYVGKVQSSVQESIGMEPKQQEEAVKKQAETAIQSSSEGSTASMIMAPLSFLLDFILVLVYTFLILLYRTKLKNFILDWIPPPKKAQGKEILLKSSQVTQDYLRGLIYMIGVLWVLYGTGFSLLGLEGALFFAVLCGLLEIIPFIGNLTGSLLAVLGVLIQGGSTEMLIGVVLLYFFVQGVQTYLLEPLIVGKQVEINPLFTILALVAGELIWGIAGMVIAIPFLAIIKVLCDHIRELNPIGKLIGNGEKQ